MNILSLLPTHLGKWKLMKGIDTNTRLLRSIIHEGFLAIDDDRIVLTKVSVLYSVVWSLTVIPIC